MLPIDTQNPLVKLVVDIILDQIAERGPKLVKEVQKRIKNSRKKQTHVLRVDLVNRESEQRAIQAALKGNHRLRILYFIGEGGAGKTRLLQIAEQFINNGEKSSKPLRWGGLHDFYHTELHSVTAIQRAIVQGLDPMEVHFQGYRKSQERFDRLLAEGLVGPALEAERQTLNDLFFGEYRAFSKKYKPVLALDTIESLTHESDWVESLCNLDEAPIASREWIISQIGRLENSVILMAGRPQPVFRRSLEKANHTHPGQLEIIELNGLTREDTRQFLAMLLKEAPSSLKPLMENADQLWHITRGLPVQLALAVDLASHGQFITHDDTSREESVESWGQRLVGELFSGDNPETRVLLLLALARKGMTADLLHYLEPERSVSNCGRQLEQLRTTSIVKTRPEHDELFLHDALYELFDTYSPPLPELEPRYERLADYHRARHLRPEQDVYPRSQTAINLLYYELQRNPRHAFDAVYLPLREKALKGHELELDLQLRDELLRFIRNPAVAHRNFARRTLTQTDVDRDGAVRWIKRYLIQSHYQKAILVAETILSLGPRPYSKINSHTAEYEIVLPDEQIINAREVFKNSDSLFWGNILTYYGESLIYTGAPVSQTRQIIDLSIRVLSSFTLDHQEPLAWLQSRILGRAYNTSGYLLRSHGQYGGALLAYQNSLESFNKTDILDEQADTLNNLAFILALLGASRRAMDHVNQALELRQRLGQKYPLALSHNTRGLIYALQGQYELGRKESQLALNMFEELETPRGIGLAYNALGYILRKQGEGWKSGQCTPSQASQYFQQSAGHFEQAEEVFSKQIAEPIRLWEAYNEQGSLYREWGCLLDEQNDKEAADALYSKAVEYQMKALEIARQYGMRFQEADTYDDLAKVSRDQGDTKKAKYWLKRALTMVPREYTLPPDKKRQGIPSPGEAHWLILGKVYFQQGAWAIQALAQGTVSKKKRKKYNQSTIRNFTLAAHYFERFWPRTSANRFRLQFMADQILKLSIPTREIKWAIKDESVRYHLDVSAFLRMFPAKPVNYSAGRVS